MDAFPPGLVAVAADEAGRYTQFAASMQGLRLPAGTQSCWLIGNDFAHNRNVAVRALLDGDGLGWLWFIDDDQAFAPDLLERLLTAASTLDLDVVAPLMLRRQQPFAPVATLDGDYLDLSRFPANGVVEVDATSTSGMLISRSLLAELVEADPDRPLFALEDGVSEDYVFCRKVRESGGKIHVDLGARIGHLTTCAVWPAIDADHGWVTGFTVADGFKLVTRQCLEALQ